MPLLEVGTLFAVPVLTQPVLSAFVMVAALGLLRVRRAAGLKSDETTETAAHRLLRRVKPLPPCSPVDTNHELLYGKGL